jgi:hypothetical protein
MAKINGNVCMQGVKGMFGKQVIYKERKGRPYVAAPPNVNENRKPTAGQRRSQMNFSECTAYAKHAIQDAATKSAYQAAAQPWQSAYNKAHQDAHYMPEVKSIHFQGYKGQAGNLIYINAVDDFRVASVTVTICDSAGIMVEQGAADRINDTAWMYLAITSHEQVTGFSIKAEAVDLPGNKASLSVQLS